MIVVLIPYNYGAGYQARIIRLAFARSVGSRKLLAAPAVAHRSAAKEIPKFPIQ
jgi:hypothetical protein